MMRHHRENLLLRIVLPAMLLASVADVLAKDTVTTAFVQHIQSSGDYDEQTKQFIARAWTTRQEQRDAEDFLLEALALISPRFRDGVAAFEEDRYEDSARIMGGLKTSLDPYVCANAAACEVKALVALDDLEQAAIRIAELLAIPNRLEQFSHSAPEVHYMRAYCQVGNLKHTEAIKSLTEFLDRYPDASSRLRLTAQQMLTELLQRSMERLGEVTDLMDYAARRLSRADAGETVLGRQTKIVDILDQLIEEAKERENSNKGSGGSSGNQSQPQQKPGQGKSPMQDSRLPGGAPNSEQHLRNRSVLPGEAWGTMKPADRDRIIQHLDDRFPDRYRQLVEQYYLQLSEE